MDFLPDHLDPSLKFGIYGLLLFHLFIFVVWIILMLPTLKKDESIRMQINNLTYKKEKST